jgi:hypothetical protein
MRRDIVLNTFDFKGLFLNKFLHGHPDAAESPVEDPDRLPKTPTVPGRLAILVTERWTWPPAGASDQEGLTSVRGVFILVRCRGKGSIGAIGENFVTGPAKPD